MKRRFIFIKLFISRYLPLYFSFASIAESFCQQSAKRVCFLPSDFKEASRCTREARIEAV